jgi:hypothetical protein
MELVCTIAFVFHYSDSHSKSLDSAPVVASRTVRNDTTSGWYVSSMPQTLANTSVLPYASDTGHDKGLTVCLRHWPTEATYRIG